MSHVWIDIDNPPQVQYLAPLVRAFEDAGAELTVTARNAGITVPLLRDRGIEFHEVGEAFGPKRRQKAFGLLKRSRSLSRLLRKGSRPTALVSSSRSSALAAKSMGIPSFIICDYEHAELALYRLAGSNILHPESIDAEVFVERGFTRERLISFPGIKEDITFAGIDVEAVPPHPLGTDERMVHVLFRPPAEESHYYTSRSRTIAIDLLEHLARKDSVLVVFSPRYRWQSEYLDRFEWSTPPLLLERPVPFVALLKSVDLVVSSGGSMLREAAWLGVPAYSIFQSELGSVDRYLEKLGLLTFIATPDQFPSLRFVKLQQRAHAPHVRGVPQQIVRAVLGRSG